MSPQERCQSPLRTPDPFWHVSVQRLFLQHTSSAETECLKMSCSCVLVSSTMEYLSKERTLPEIFAPFSRCTVMCLPAARATLRNDSCTLMTDMIQPRIKTGSQPPLWPGRADSFICPTK